MPIDPFVRKLNGFFIWGREMWWPFAKRGTRVDFVASATLGIELPADLSVFGNNEACIKVWLPEKLIKGIDILGGTHGMSRPDVLRRLLFEHTYGRPALERLNQWKQQRDAQAPGIRMSPKQHDPSARQITTQLLGKSVEGFKLWLPAPLKGALTGLAKEEQLGLSDYIRKTLVRILLGESVHNKWQKAIGKLPAAMREFEREDI